MKYPIVLLCLLGVLSNAHAQRPAKIIAHDAFVYPEVIKKMFNEMRRVPEKANGTVSAGSIGEFKMRLDRPAPVNLMQEVGYTVPSPRAKRILDDHTEILSEKKQVRYV